MNVIENEDFKHGDLNDFEDILHVVGFHKETTISLLCPNCRWHAVLPSSNSGLNIWLRSNSNAASITRTKRNYYPRTYPTLLVYPDGSTITIRYKEPRRIIRMPVDLSKLSEAERARVLTNRKPKQKIELVEDFDDNLDLNAYSKYFKKT